MPHGRSAASQRRWFTTVTTTGVRDGGVGDTRDHKPSRSQEGERLAGLLQHAAELRRVAEKVEVACLELEKHLRRDLSAAVHEQVANQLAQHREHQHAIHELIAALEGEASRQKSGAASPRNR